MEHLTFNEIVDAIYTTELTPESARHIARVNAHVMNCPDCFKIHKAVYEIYELGFEQGLDVVNERLQELEEKYSLANDSSIAEKVKNYITQIALDVENGKKLILNNIKSLSTLKYYYSYPIALATRGGNQQIDTSKLIDDENVDNLIELNDGLLKIQFSKIEYDGISMPYPSIEILTDNEVIYDGPMDEDNEKLFKCVKVKDNEKLYINIWE